MKIIAVLFDLYGTLAGFEPSRFSLQSEVAKKYGQNVKVTLAGRSINNGMVSFVTKMILKDINLKKFQ